MKISGLLFILLLVSSCERFLITPSPPSSRVSTFETVWQTLHDQYPFFGLKAINWDSLHSQYRPQISDDMTDQALAQRTAAMLLQLRDGHVKLLAGTDEYGYDWARNSLPNFIPTVVARYFNGQFLTTNQSFFHRLILPGVAYIYCPTFQSPGLTDENLAELADTYTRQGINNVIIDLRDNTGGLYANANRLLSLVLTQKTTVGFERYRASAAADQFTRWYSLSVSPHESPFTGKVIVLTNRRVYSAANYVVAALKGLPNVTIIGDQTGGGGSSIHYTELPNGWRLSLPASQFADRNHVLTEEGIAPDLQIDLLPADSRRGKDTLIETALALLK